MSQLPQFHAMVYKTRDAKRLQYIRRACMRACVCAWVGTQLRTRAWTGTGRVRARCMHAKKLQSQDPRWQSTTIFFFTMVRPAAEMGDGRAICLEACVKSGGLRACMVLRQNTYIFVPNRAPQVASLPVRALNITGKETHF